MNGTNPAEIRRAPKPDPREGRIAGEKSNDIHTDMESDCRLQATPQPQVRHGKYLDRAEQQHDDRI
jgi:hypothetical protein